MDRGMGEKTPPGSDYFKPKATVNSSKKECLDFISFEPETPTKQQNTTSFSPSSFSSPFSNRSPGFNKSWHGNSQRGNYNGGFKQKGWSPHDKNNSWQGHSGPRRGGPNFRRNFNQGQRNSNRHSGNIEFDPKLFLHSSFTEDPWAQLEEQLKSLNEAGNE